MDKHYFMGIAREVAKKSKDPNTKVGALIVDEQNRILSTGYNGMVQGADEGNMWQTRENKLHCVVHAEMNALLFSERRNLKGCVMFTTHGPCPSCLKHALQMGIRDIRYETVYTRFTSDEKLAIYSLLEGTRAIAWNINGDMPYIGELYA